MNRVNQTTNVPVESQNPQSENVRTDNETARKAAQIMQKLQNKDQKITQLERQWNVRPSDRTSLFGKYCVIS